MKNVLSVFFSRVKGRRVKNQITQIKDQKGDVVKSDKEILEVFRKFYKNLYTRHCGGESMQDDLLDEIDFSGARTVPETINFTREDIRKVIFDCRNNKTPGPDALPIRVL